jgi:lysozyme family protein
MSALYTLDRLRPEYAALFDRMEITNSKRAAAKSQALKIIANKDRYKAVEQRTGIPWFVVGCIHFRESKIDRETGAPRFDTYLGNGDPLNHRTVNVPIGRGPFSSFIDGAYDALITVENLEEIHDWTGPECAAYAFEKINGFAYRNPSRNIPSPYLWGGTNLQKPGKFIRDHVYDPNVMDTQLGAMATLRMLMDMDSEVVFGSPPPVVASPPTAPVELPAAPPSPRADDTEGNVKPLSQSMTIRGLILKVTGIFSAGGALFFDFLKTPFGFATFCVAIGAIGLGFVMILKGRIDVQAMLKHLSIDDTKPA